jgi:NAD(P)-dependent dehydrogenase (short-subunit alcohol dehydrogenase family)
MVRMNASNYDVAADGVVLHVVTPVAPAKPIEEMHDVDIASMYDSEVRVALMLLKHHRAEGATRFVFVIPSMVEMGAAGHAATCAAAEAVRVLALGAARQWMADGVTVNCLSAPWPYAESLDDDIAPIVAFLTSDAGASVSGETIRIGGPERGL